MINKSSNELRHEQIQINQRLFLEPAKVKKEERELSDWRIKDMVRSKNRTVAKNIL